MDFTKRFTEVVVVLDHDEPDIFTPAAVTGAYVSLANYHRAVLFLHVGDMVATATLDASIRQAQDATGTGVKAITGKAITQLTQAGGDGNQIVVIELRTEELDIANGFEHISYLLTVGVANVEMAATLFGIVARFKPVPTTQYDEIVD